ncbi:Sulfate transporter 1.2 [Acorus gramineus]|uniref:Sulfate transporter 1.2 n=1 Tax=Acorus gramineus TaxID=55184 RepID=A0AAV9A408_ACOGR|nr:Sulfate transporter 1.2 [Acorus gramineus]
MGGAAITIALQRLKGFLGIAKFTTKTDIIHVMESVWKMCIMASNASLSSGQD